MLRVPNLPKKKSYQSVAVLTSGGDAPGMNAAIRAVVRFGIDRGLKVFGVERGYSGLLEGRIEEMGLSSVANIIQRGGTILKTSRCPAFLKKSARQEAANILRRKGVDALVVIGGDGSFAGAHLLQNEARFPIIGIPGTIDNDIPGSDDSIGFDTAINTGLEAIDRIRDTASSHDRVFLIEVMGRSTGFIALQVGIGGGAETIVVPEMKSPIQKIARSIDRGIQRGKSSSIIVVAEGPKEGLADRLGKELDRLGYSPRVCILGHVQRGGTPSAHDRFLASVLGAGAIEYLLAGRSNCMLGVRNDALVIVPFKRIFRRRREFLDDLVSLSDVLAR